MPPPPKHPSLRARRNREVTRANLPAGKPFTPGPLPVRLEDGVPVLWHERTKAWWENVWSSPMAGEYLESDRDGLLRVAELVDAFNWHPTASLAAEIRMQEQRFGLSPIDRRRLQWEVNRGEEAEDERKKRQGRAATKAKPRKADPRKVLAFGRKR